MRRVICRYEDSQTFLDDLVCAGPRPGLTFGHPSGLPTGETVRIVLIVEDSDERHTLHMHIDDRTPTLGENSDVRWRYRATATDADAPWLEMLVEKLETARQLGTA